LVAGVLLVPSVIHDVLGVARFGGSWFYLANGQPDIAAGAILGSALVVVAAGLSVVAAFLRDAVMRLVLLALALVAWAVSLITDLYIDARLANTFKAAFEFWARLRAWLGLQPRSYYVAGGYFHPTLGWIASIGFTLAAVAMVVGIVLCVVVAVRRPTPTPAPAGS
jgi:hypothetical protein